MSRLRVRPSAPDKYGVVIDITPESADWEYVGFGLARLEPGRDYDHHFPDRETCLVIVSGTADVIVADKCFPSIGGRKSPFEDAPPGAVYVPANTYFKVKAHDNVELAICTAPGGSGLAPRVISGSDMPMEIRGKGNNQRFVRNILPQEQPAHSLLVVEVITPSGNWSSYPPHKHDTASANTETALEETYYHRINPPQGFAFQRVYTDQRDIDEAIAIENGDVVMVPRGYHPVAAPHGYDLYYLNVMAGPERKWIFRNDPVHEWILFEQ